MRSNHNARRVSDVDGRSLGQWRSSATWRSGSVRGSTLPSPVEEPVLTPDARNNQDGSKDAGSEEHRKQHDDDLLEAREQHEGDRMSAMRTGVWVQSSSSAILSTIAGGVGLPAGLDSVLCVLRSARTDVRSAVGVSLLKSKSVRLMRRLARLGLGASGVAGRAPSEHTVPPWRSSVENRNPGLSIPKLARREQGSRTRTSMLSACS